MDNQFLEEFIESKAKLLALTAYVNANTSSYLSSKVIKGILGLEVTEDDD